MNSERRQLIALCLNPAWQRTLIFAQFTTGAVNRAERLCEAGGGKGINAARAIRLAGGTVSVALFAGGHTGDQLRAELKAAGSGEISVSVDTPTRTCTTIVDRAAGTVTELIEPSGRVSAEQVDALRERILAALPGGAAVALCGTVPPGVPESFYGDIARAARAAGALVVLDGVTGVGAALAAGVDLLKVNAAELRVLAGAVDLATAARQCRARWGVGWIGVTDGPGAAWLFGPDGATRFDLPRLDRVRSTIGAGDCVTGVLLQRLAGSALSAATVGTAFAEALAAAAASCLTDTPAEFDPAVAAELRRHLGVVQLTTGGIP